MTARTPDGSKASAAVQDPDAADFETCFDVFEYGPRDLWTEIENAWSAWLSAGSPTLQDHLLVVGPDGEHRVVTREGEKQVAAVTAMPAPVF